MGRLRRFGLLALLAAVVVVAYILLKPEGDVIPGTEGIDGAGGEAIGGQAGGGALPGSEIPGGGPAPTGEPGGPLEASIEIVQGHTAMGTVRRFNAAPGQHVVLSVTTQDTAADGSEVVYDVRLYLEPDYADITQQVSRSRGYRFEFDVPEQPQRPQYELNIDKEFNGDPSDDGPLAVITYG